MGIALVSVGIFFMHNAFCCSGLTPTVRSFPVKSPAGVKTLLLLFHPGDAGGLLSAQDSKAWLFFLVSTVAFGLLII